MKALLIHISSVSDARRELIQEFHDIFLSQSEIFSSPCVFICTILISLLEGAPIESMCDFSCFAELESIFLCYCIECLRLGESSHSSVNSSPAMFCYEQVSYLSQCEVFLICRQNTLWIVSIFTVTPCEKTLSMA